MGYRTLLLTILMAFFSFIMLCSCLLACNRPFNCNKVKVKEQKQLPCRRFCACCNDSLSLAHRLGCKQSWRSRIKMAKQWAYFFRTMPSLRYLKQAKMIILLTQGRESCVCYFPLYPLQPVLLTGIQTATFTSPTLQSARQ